MNGFDKFRGHLGMITRHKLAVMQYCFMAGLYRQGLLHDMSKLSPVEFFAGVKYYTGKGSPNNAQRLSNGYSRAWLHHKGRNKHHLEYWIDYGTTEQRVMTGMKMPKRYVVEMFCDRIGACRAYQGDAFTLTSPLEYYEKSKSHLMLHDETRALLEKLLHMLAARGEAKTFRYIRRCVLKNTGSTGSNGSENRGNTDD